jgi:transformation/transcription domain-associated protein
MRQLAHGNIELAQSWWVSLLKQSWDCLASDAMRKSLVPGFEVLLARPYHKQNLYFSRLLGGDYRSCSRLNIVTGLLRGVTALSPTPNIDADLLGSLGSNFNAWYDAIPFMEARALEAKTPQEKHVWQSAMKALLDCLGENDLSFALKRDMCQLDSTKRALSLEMYDQLSEAEKMYDNLISTGGEAANEPVPMQIDGAVAPLAAAAGATLTEMSLWEERWVAINRSLGQWSVLSHYAAGSGCAELQMECSWKNRDWENVRSMTANPSIVAALEGGNPKHKLQEIYLSIADGKLNEVEKLCAQTVQLALHNWQLLPPLSTRGEAHVELLRLFHRLVELRESGQIMMEVSAHTRARTYPDLKNILATWRERLPNKWDPLDVFDDLFTWRGHMFAAVTSNFHWSDPSSLAALHDRPWTVIRLSKTARKQGVRDVCLTSLSKLYSVSTMDVHDAFQKLREQIVACRDGPDTATDLRGGLSIVNNTNLDYFSSQQKAELFRLKASFLSALGSRSKANQAYCHSSQISPGYGKTWLSWGEHCVEMAEATEVEAAAVGAEGAAADYMMKIIQLNAQAMGCFLEAVKCGYDNARMHLSSVLWMLRKDGDKEGLLVQTLTEKGTSLPEWVWIPYIPILLSSLGRVEGKTVKMLLEKIGARYPQSLYYGLRAFFFERRDMEKGSGDSGPKLGFTSGSAAEEIMGAMRKTHSTLWSGLESMLEELITRFRPSLEEELLAAVDAMLLKTNQVIELQGKTVGDAQSGTDILENMKVTLQKVYEKYFVDDASDKKREQFNKTFKGAFQKHFLATGSVKDMETVISRLQLWRRRLRNAVSAAPSASDMNACSPSLAQISNESPDLWAGSCDAGSNGNGVGKTASGTAAAAAAAASAAVVAASEGGAGSGSAAIEIPGQYDRDDCRPSPELHSKLLKFGSVVETLTRNGQPVRRILMRGADGRACQFLLQFTIPYVTSTDERAQMVIGCINRLLRRNVGARRRHLELQRTAIVPLNQRLRLTADNEKLISLSDVANEAIEGGVERIERVFRKRITEVGHDAAFAEVCGMVGKDAMKRHMMNLLDGPEALFSFKKMLSGQLAGSSIMQYMFCCVDRSLDGFVFGGGDGQVLNTHFKPGYNNSGLLEREETPVIEPAFRLTRNVSEMMGDMMIEGSFVPCMGSIANSIVGKKALMEPLLALVLRDDLMSWHRSKTSGNKSDAESRVLEAQLAERSRRNVTLVMNRVTACSVSTAGEADGIAVDAQLKALVDSCRDDKKLAWAPVSFAAWF